MFCKYSVNISVIIFFILFAMAEDACFTCRAALPILCFFYNFAIANMKYFAYWIRKRSIL